VAAFTYLLLNLFTISFPLVRSFEHRVNYVSKWRYLFPAIAITGFVFIVWDIWFTQSGVWSFNAPYLLGIYLFHLPIEEWLFFLAVPFACVFIYEVLRYFVKTDILANLHTKISWALVVVLGALLIANFGKLYTTVCFAFTITWLLLQLLFIRGSYMGRFYLTFLLSLIPFMIVNGVLTSLPVVMYNDAQNLGIRLYTIPVEDTMYNLSMLLMNISIYEYLMERYSATTHQNTSQTAAIINQ